MSRYVRTVLLVLAGVFFMIPILGRPAAARPMPRMHGFNGANHPHQAIEDDGLGDDPAAPCVDQ